jgi:prevent-host-death family protein
MATERARSRHTERGRAKARPISELQRDAPEIVREASERGEVAITRYGETVAYVISPEERERAQEIERALDRAIWAIDLKRAMEALKAGDVVDWEDAAAELRARFIER